MDKMREEFSKHCQIWRYSEEVDENDFFVNATTQRAWDVWFTAWQASRQALVFELPRARSDVDYGYEPSEIIDLLELAGIKCT